MGTRDSRLHAVTLELEDAAVYSHESHSELFVTALADGFDRHHEAFHFSSPIPMIYPL